MEITKNINFAIWKRVFSNFIGSSPLNRDRQIAVFFILEHNGRSQVYRVVSEKLSRRLQNNKDLLLTLTRLTIQNT